MCSWIPNPKHPLIIMICTCIREVNFSQFSVLDLQSSFENFVSLVSSDGDVGSDFLVSLDTETSDSESSSGWDWFLSSKIFKDLWGWIRGEIPLVSLSPDSPTEMLRTIFSILISLIGFYFSTLAMLWWLIMVYKYCNDQSINILIVVNINSWDYQFDLKWVVIWFNKKS